MENLVLYRVYCKDQRNAAVIIRRYTMLLHNVKNTVHFKFKILSITWRFHVSAVVLPVYISY